MNGPWHDGAMTQAKTGMGKTMALAAGCLLLAACIPAPPDGRPRSAPVTEQPGAMIDLLLDSRVTGGDPAPVWTLRSVNPNAQSVTASRYTVRPGDTLSGIGEASGVGLEALALENGLAPPYALTPGQSLRVPGGLFHRVAAGETGIAIARAYGVAWSDVATMNALVEPFILRVGQRLRLPADARAADGLDVAARAARFSLDIDDIATGSQPALAQGAAPTAPAAAPRAPVTSAIAPPPTSFGGRFRWPLDGPILARFGPAGPGKVNQGINIAAASGTPVRAAADGVVAYAGDQIAVYGGLILINHGSGWISAYGHVGALEVQRGQAVRAGDVIGRAGATGQVQQPQLHFQLRKDRKPVDPLTQLPRTS